MLPTYDQDMLQQHLISSAQDTRCVYEFICTETGWARAVTCRFSSCPEGKLRRATSLAVPSEGDVDGAESEPARTRCRRLPPRPNKFIVQKTNHGDEHCQRLSAIRIAGCPRRVLKWLH